MNKKQIKLPIIDISEFDYSLPSSRIAKYPLQNRDESKLLEISGKHFISRGFKELPKVLPQKSLLVFNNTKVVKARLLFKKLTGAQIEIFCLEPHQPNDAALAFQQTQSVEWQCMVGNLKKWKEGVISTEATTPHGVLKVDATIVEKLSDAIIIRFEWGNSSITFAEILESMGETPIPPYLERKAEAIDGERYQTIYSKSDGSVAAPTAGLHFTENILDQITKKEMERVELTLHVGAGTFKPVKSKYISNHEMHTEHFQIQLDTLKKIAKHDGPIIAVGTTSVRTLESIYRAGVLLYKNLPFHEITQWDGFMHESSLSMKESYQLIIDYLEKENLLSFQASTSIIIVPGYEFKVIDGLITNFHQPKSTLLLLIAALIGDQWKEAYNYAMNNNFRFLSYGDSSLLMNPHSY